MLHKYLSFFRANWAGTMEYRANILIYMLSATAPLVSLAVWLSLSADGPVGNYTSTSFITYYLALIFVRQMSGAWVVFELNYLILDGGLSPKLLKPIDPIHDFLVMNLTDKIFRLPIVLIPIAIAALLIPGVQYDFSPLNLLAFLAALTLTWLIIYFSQYSIGLLTFWTSQSMAVNELWFGIRTLLSGSIAPIDLLPAPIPQLSLYLPFRYTLSFPIEIILGQVRGADLLVGFAIQLVWVLAFVALYRILWVRGLKEYSAVGA